MLEEAGPQFCHREEEPPRPSRSRPPAARGASRCPPRATEADPRSPSATECRRRGPTWAPSPTACPRPCRTRQDPFSRACTTGGPRQCSGPPGSLAPGRLLRPSRETEVLLSEEAPSVRAPRPPAGRPCRPPRAGPWRTSRRRRRPRWAAGPPSTGRPSRHLPPTTKHYPVPNVIRLKHLPRALVPTPILRTLQASEGPRAV